MDARDLYLLQDGTQADPSECSPDEKGVLRHKNGLAVCLTEDGKPQTIGMTSATNKKAADAGKEDAKPDELPLDRAAKPVSHVQDVRATRDTKAD